MYCALNMLTVSAYNNSKNCSTNFGQENILSNKLTSKKERNSGWSRRGSNSCSFELDYLE